MSAVDCVARRLVPPAAFMVRQVIKGTIAERKWYVVVKERQPDHATRANGGGTSYHTTKSLGRHQKSKKLYFLCRALSLRVRGVVIHTNEHRVPKMTFTESYILVEGIVQIDMKLLLHTSLLYMESSS